MAQLLKKATIDSRGGGTKFLTVIFNRIKKDEKAMKRLWVDNTENTEYWKLEAKLKEKLLLFLYLEFTQLSKENFLILCDLVSRYRPVALHTFFSSVSLRKAETEPDYKRGLEIMGKIMEE